MNCPYCYDRKTKRWQGCDTCRGTGVVEPVEISLDPIKMLPVPKYLNPEEPGQLEKQESIRGENYRGVHH